MKKLNIMLHITRMLSTAKNLDDGILAALAFIGDYYHVSRAYVFELGEDNLHSSNTYEWCAEGVSAEKDNLQDIPVTAYGYDTAFINRDVVTYPSLMYMTPDLREIIEPQGIYAMIHCAIRDNGVFKGYIGFDDCISSRPDWTVDSEETKCLEFCAGLLSLYLIKERNLHVAAVLNKQLANEQAQFRDALVRDALFTVNVDFTDGYITEDIVDEAGNSLLKPLGCTVPAPYTETTERFFDTYLFEPIGDAATKGILKQEDIRRTFLSGSSLEILEYHIRTLDKYVRFIPLLYKHPETEHIMGVCVAKDISEQYLKERKLKEEQEAFLKAMSRSYIAIYHFNLIESVCHKLHGEDFTDYIPKNTTVGEAISLFEEKELTPEEVGANCDFWNCATITERMEDTNSLAREVYTRNNGWIRMNLIAYQRDGDGVVTEVLWLFRIVDKQKKKELEMTRALEVAYEQAQLANAAKTDFLSRMSHDIRTPMNGIVGMTKLATEHIHEPERLANYLEKIRISSDHLLTLINDILELSRIESGKVTLTRELIDLRSLSRTCISVIDSNTVGRNLEIEQYYQPMESPFVYSDALRMRQVVLNIISNAVKYTPDGGSISIRFENEISADGKYMDAKMTVADTGIGMSKEFLKHIYEPFAQEDEHSARTQFVGTGLGMAISKEIIDLMGGNIQIESEKGKGTTVTVIFPVEVAGHLEVPEVREEAFSVEEVSLQGVSCLIVEDNELNREVASELLSERGLEVTMAVDGRDAVEKFKASQPGEFDFILMDIMMPVMNGIEATKAIRALERPDAGIVPIIAMTANAFAEDVAKSIEAGMNAHLSKPIDINKVMVTIRKYLI